LKRFHLSGERSAEGVSVDHGALRDEPVQTSKPLVADLSGQPCRHHDLRQSADARTAIVKAA